MAGKVTAMANELGADAGAAAAAGPSAAAGPGAATEFSLVDEGSGPTSGPAVRPPGGRGVS